MVRVVPTVAQQKRARMTPRPPGTVHLIGTTAIRRAGAVNPTRSTSRPHERRISCGDQKPPATEKPPAELLPKNVFAVEKFVPKAIDLPDAL